MPLLANVVRKPSDSQQIGRAKQQNSVVDRQPFARQNLVGDRLQTLVGNGQFSHISFKTSEIFKRAKGLLQRPRTAGTTY